VFRALGKNLNTLGKGFAKEHTAKKLSVKRPLPSVFYRALGKGFGRTEKF
jgi:hypothetical protein